MATLHYQDEGSGEPLVLLHSGGMTGAEWAPQLPALARRFRVIVPDQPGHGSSPMVAERLTIGDCGRAVLALLDELEVHKAAFCGSSMGGATALWLTLNAPQRVSKLMLYRVGYAKDDTTHSGTRGMADPDYWRSMGLDKWLSKIHTPQGGPAAWETVIGRVAEALDPADSDHAHRPADLERILVPTLIACGDRDPLVPLEVLMEMHRRIPDSALWLMPYASHVTASNTWRADCFALELMRFLMRRD